jgi:uncharacterized protein YdaU (DUF1376 family)
MAEQPWFKFYASDYLLDPDVDAMPREAEALLIRMWCICHREGSCPADAETLARKALCNLQYVSQYKPHCEAFFELQDGRFYSRRMQEEKRRSEKARNSANERWKQKQCRLSESKPESEPESERRNAIRITKTLQFVPPTLEEVQAYCLERGNQVDPEKFFYHYSANGWRVGRNPMKDWKAAVRTWERNGVDHGNGNGAIQRQADNIRALNAAFPLDR